MNATGFKETFDKAILEIAKQRRNAVAIAARKIQGLINPVSTGNRKLRIIAAQMLQNVNVTWALLYFFSRNSLQTNVAARQRRKRNVWSDDVLLK